MTLEEALPLIPTHIMLRPGIDKWQAGDEFLMTHDQYLKNSWEKAFAFMKTVMPEEIGRRAIPESVRQAMAWWHTLWDICQTRISYGVLTPILEDYDWYRDKINEYRIKYGYPQEAAVEEARQHLESLWKNFDEKEIELLGGYDEILKNLHEGSNAFHRWLLSTQETK